MCGRKWLIADERKYKRRVWFITADGDEGERRRVTQGGPWRRVPERVVGVYAAYDAPAGCPTGSCPVLLPLPSYIAWTRLSTVPPTPPWPARHRENAGPNPFKPSQSVSSAFCRSCIYSSQFDGGRQGRPLPPSSRTIQTTNVITLMLRVCILLTWQLL